MNVHTNQTNIYIIKIYKFKYFVPIANSISDVIPRCDESKMNKVAMHPLKASTVKTSI